MPTCRKLTHRPKKLRSYITNDPRRLPGVDMRSARGRRYSDIVDALEAEFGSEDNDALREIASLKLSLEDAQADAINGDVKAREDQVRLSNLLTRRETALRNRKAKAASKPGLAAYLASKQAPATP